MYYKTDHTDSNGTEEITIRPATRGDGAALRHLAQLDSAPSVPAGELLVALEGGEMRAAVSVETGDAIADPFRATAEIVKVLRMRADQVEPSAGSTGVLRPLAA